MNHNFLFFFFMLLFHAALSDYLDPGPCKPQTCGGLQNITYPFWVEQSQPSYCGVPEFKLSCTDDKLAVLTLSGDDYYVRNILYNDKSVVLSNTQFFDGKDCKPRHNFSFLHSFQLNTTTNINIHLFWGCDSSLVGSLGPAQICPGVIAVPDDYHDLTKLVGECAYSVLAPVWSLEIGEGIDGYLKSLKDGFLLDWDTSMCVDGCVSSGGRCGYNISRNSAICLCEDRVHFLECFGDSSGTKSLVKKSVTGFYIGAAIIITLVIAILVVFRRSCYNIFFKETRKDGSVNVEKFMKDYCSMLPTKFSYIDVKRMTNGFRDILGRGGYGIVYKGKLPNEQFIAAKILEKSKDTGQDFINEVATIGRMHHFNIIRLLGFCCEGSRRALVYEYMPNGSLGDLISNEQVRCSLGQEKLLEIAIGIANGIQYMHNGCDTRILHLDIKPQNVLLDHDYHPKISDFGLAKLYSRKDSLVSLTGARGTVGYIAPEVFMRNVGGVSHKSDVYSYGMLLLDMVVGRKNVEFENDRSSMLYFPNWIYIQLDQWKEMELDGSVVEEVMLHIVRKMVLVGLWCIQINPSDRPSISKVLEMLDGGHDNIEIPPKPFFPSSPRQRWELQTSSADNIDAVPLTDESI